MLKHHLKEWEISKVENGELSTWKREYLENPTHELHATHKKMGQQLEILLNDKDEENWLFRSGVRIRKPLIEIVNFFDTGLPYLSSEIVLLYKAKPIDSKDIYYIKPGQLK